VRCQTSGDPSQKLAHHSGVTVFCLLYILLLPGATMLIFNLLTYISM